MRLQDLLRPQTFLAFRKSSSKDTDYRNVDEDNPLPVHLKAPNEVVGPITYKTYNMTVAGNSWYPANHAALSTDLSRSPSAVLIVADNDVQIKFNDTDNNAFVWDVSEAGKVLEFSNGEFIINDLYFAAQLPSGTAADVHIQILAY